MIGEKQLDISDFYQLLFQNTKVTIAEESLKTVKSCFEFLREFSKGKIIYGINTGLGPMAQYRIDENDQTQLQYNLIRSHSAGCGDALPGIYVKAAMIARLNTLSLGFSGVHPEVIELLASLINHDVYPFIPEHGGVGASGDLVQLSHLALVLIGEGEVFYKDELRATAEVFEEIGLNAIHVHIREGLALINGTSVMTGIGIVNTIHAENLLKWSVIASAMINEIVESYDDHFSVRLNASKLHGGQQEIARAMREIVADSALIRKREDHLFNGKENGNVINHKVQEYYSLRCVPQILGPVYDTISNTKKVLEEEVNSVNDNPVIDHKNQDVLHGGNFHGDYVSFEMDKLKIAITKLSMLAERQLNFLLNDKLNNILPPFINLGKLGLNLGLQGTQFTATSTVAENQTLSNPMYIHSIPNNNDNQDIVSMGTNAALITKKIIDNTFQVLAIEFLAIVQAIDYLGQQSKLSVKSREIFHQIRDIVPRFEQDTIKYKDIDNIRDFLINNRPNIL
ncbi:MAG: aromatic amino acid ammonia-lyase [Bacteroidales bacterium]|nr:aromatic amino acid ammonia-lyase [Bacteroidales bacterium]MCF8457557.1 aromatic amino acid ammonia-lyase [Bacteroidales bacterium]